MDQGDTRLDADKRASMIEEAAAALIRSRSTLKDVSRTLARELHFLRDQQRQQARKKSVSAIARQRLNWTVPVTQPIVLCSQIQRSGGTLFARLFDGHPACFVHPFELKWGKPRKWNWPALNGSTGNPEEVFAQLDEGWPAKFAGEGYRKYSSWMGRQKSEEMQPYPFLFDLDLQRMIFAEQLSRSETHSQRDLMNAYLTALFNAWLDYQNLYRQPKKWVAAFIPKLLMARDSSTDKFFTDYPDGLVVTIVRDPESWLASVNRHFANIEQEFALDNWIESAEASVRAHRDRPGNVIVLVFEDLVHRTEAVMRMLCQRMAIDFNDVLLHPTYNSMPVLSDSSHAPATGVDSQVTSRYRDVLTPEQLDAVARRATPHYADIRERFSLQQLT
jgi:hypothetical protein